MAPDTFVHTLVARAEERGKQPAFTFLLDGETQQRTLTFEEVDRRAKAIAATLIEAGGRGKRALLLYAPDLEYVCGFLGCLYAGVTAVPAYPPDPARIERTLPRLRAIAEDAGADIVLTTSDIRGLAELLFVHAPELAKKTWLSTDEVSDEAASGWRDPDVRADNLAFIQYTSGSTGQPKGVVLTHRNLQYNLGMILAAFGASESSVGFSWLPPYHDMGLIGGILGPLACGAHSALMSPIAFLKRPMRWLEGITRFGATISGGPNFAYELCIRRATPGEVEQLDLSTWNLAFSGAEPVRPDTLDRFTETFLRCGFQRRAFYPCYGLAEATLIVSGGTREAEPKLLKVEPKSLETGVVQTTDGSGRRQLVGCGEPLGGQRVLVVDPQRRRPCPQGVVGEIWISGPSVSTAYWGNEQATERALRSHLADGDSAVFLRTGDLGFMRDGELFVTGRLKDLIIIRGRNLYPQDLERTAEESHPSLRRGCCAAFSLEIDGGEEVAVAVELERRYHERRRKKSQPPKAKEQRKTSDRRSDPSDLGQLSTLGAALPRPSDMDEVCESIRSAVAEHHQVRPYLVLLVKAGFLPKTSSGKIQRSETRRMFSDGDLEVLEQSVLDVHSTARPPVSTRAPLDTQSLVHSTAAARKQRVVAHLLELIASGIGASPEAIPVDVPVAKLGLDSLAAVEIAHELERELGAIVPTTSFLRDGTIMDLARQVSEALDNPPPSSLPASTVPGNGMASGQEGLWLLQQLDPQSAAYNVHCGLRLGGEIADEVVTGALHDLVVRHDVLRSHFPKGPEGQPRLALNDSAEVAYTRIDATGLSDAQLSDRASTDAHMPFDLERGPLFRVFRYARDEDSVLVISAHHIIVDFWAMTMLLEELLRTIDARLQNTMAALPPPGRYVDFVAWQHRRVKDAGERHLAFWRERLAAPLPRMDLPTDRPRPRFQSNRGAALRFDLPVELVARVRDYAKASRTTPYVVMLSAFFGVLERWSGSADLIVGTPAACRTRAEFSNAIGFLINPVVIRSVVERKSSFDDLVEQVRQNVLDALDHQEYPFAELVHKLEVQRDPARSPVFDVMFAYEQGRIGQDAMAKLALGIPGAKMSREGGLSVESFTLPPRSAQFDLSMMVADTDDGYTVWIHYCTDLFEASSMRRFSQHYARLLATVLHKPNRPLRSVPLVSPAEAEEMTVDWNATEMAFPNATVDQLVAEAIERHPNVVAIRCGDHAMSYEELGELSDSLAATLLERGAAPEQPVGVFLERSIDLLVAQLAVLKAGAFFVPLDPSYPMERLVFMIESSGAKLVVSDARLSPRIAADGVAGVVDVAASRARKPLPPTPRSPSQIAYVMYTSGSTGRPKGVAVPHRGVVSFLTSMRESPGMKAGDVIAAVTTSSFDISVLELFLPLTVGATIEMMTSAEIEDGRALVRALDQRGVTVMQATPSLWGLLEDAGGAPPRVRPLCGGEALPDPLAQLLSRRHGSVTNLYGPTETTIWSSTTTIASGEKVSLGRPIGNTAIYVLDEHGSPSPPGVRGEIHIGGAGVVRGYWGRPDLTAERFLPDPHGSSSGRRMYRTGDMARFSTHGQIEYLGRQDNQVKLRGHRIELGEIERVLSAHVGVREAAVVVLGGAGGQTLVAFAVPNEDDAVGPHQLRHYLSDWLPRYMVPARVEVLEALPRTLNRKIDRRALELQASEQPHLVVVEPSTDTERTLCRIFAEVLDHRPVGVQHDFFALGGHSLLATRLVNSITSELGVELPIRTIFEHPTVAGLAPRVEEHMASTSSVRRGALFKKPIRRARRRSVGAMGAATDPDPTEGS